MGVRNVRYICPHCKTAFRGEKCQRERLGRDPACSYECDRWVRYRGVREALIANWPYARQQTRYQASAWLASR